MSGMSVVFKPSFVTNCIKSASRIKSSSSLPTLKQGFIGEDIKFKNLPFIVRLFCLITKKPQCLFLWMVPFLSTRSQNDKGGEVVPRLVGQTRAIKQAIQEADEMFESNKYQEAVSALLPYRDSGDVELLWRLSRVQYNLSQSSSITEAEKRRLIQEAFDAVSEALARDDSHWAAHKWMSVLLDARSAYDGIKARVMQLERVKNHMLRATELNPKDATTLYMLGSWCYQIADMPWIQRKIAATIFASPPTASYEEALHYFSKAEEIEPRFYSQNLLMLGKTLLKLQRLEEAAHYLSLARDYYGSTEEDSLVKKEAVKILDNLKINKS